jgi:hypothetical protein
LPVLCSRPEMEALRKPLRARRLLGPFPIRSPSSAANWTKLKGSRANDSFT